MADWSWYPPSKPRRPAKDGIAAKAKKGAPGKAWWSKRFVHALEAITSSARLSRGRSYARSGQVMGLVVSPGVVRAKVQGSRARPYAVELTLAAWDADAWARIEAALAERALFAAALLAGDVPHEIEAVLAELGSPLFPTRASDLRTECSCPDWANPCKHVAATCYILAEHFDADPFAMFAWRGRDRDALLAGLRAARSAPAAADDAVEAPAVATLPVDPNAYYRAAAPLPAAAPPPSDVVPDAVLRELGPLPAPGGDLVPALAAAYVAIVAHARAKLGEG
jgi:uncharacterized Zn finger protein